MSLETLTYTSCATDLFDFSALEAFLEKCRARNKELGITGMLLLKRRSFMQVIEGSKASIAELFEESICKDPRHQSISVLDRREIQERRFASWTMGFGDAERLSPEDSREFNRFFNDGFTEEVMPGRKEIAEHLLLSFRDIA